MAERSSGFGSHDGGSLAGKESAIVWSSAASRIRSRETSAAGTSGQSARHASVLAVSLYSILTGIVLKRRSRRPSARIGHQSYRNTLRRAPHRNPATDQEPFANDFAKTTVAEVTRDRVAYRDDRSAQMP